MMLDKLDTLDIDEQASEWMMCVRWGKKLHNVIDDIWCAA